jgi:hypothetical protein
MPYQIKKTVASILHLPVRIEKVESTLTQGGREVFRVLSTLAARLGKLEGVKHGMTSSGREEEPAVGLWELEIRLRRVEQEATKTKPDGIPKTQEWETGVQESIVQCLTHLEILTNDADDGFELGGQTFNWLEDCQDWLLLKGPGSESLDIGSIRSLRPATRIPKGFQPTRR